MVTNLTVFYAITKTIQNKLRTAGKFDKFSVYCYKKFKNTFLKTDLISELLFSVNPILICNSTTF